MVWEGDTTCPSLGDALEALEDVLARLLQEQFSEEMAGRPRPTLGVEP
jgi:hypothetical protein